MLDGAGAGAVLDGAGAEDEVGAGSTPAAFAGSAAGPSGFSGSSTGVWTSPGFAVGSSGLRAIGMSFLHCALSLNQMPPAMMASVSALSMEKFLSQIPGLVSSLGSGQMGVPSFFLSRPAGMRREP